MTPEQDYSLDVPQDSRRLLALGWLWLCVLALLGAGVFSLLLVVSRTPYLSEHIPWIDFFHSALVVHVNLSVLVWSLSFGGILWSLNQRPGRMWLAWAALSLASLGALVIILSPFVRDAQPLMSNYIPVLQHPVFFSGLLLFALGFTLLVLNSMFFMAPVGPWMSARGALRFGLNAAAVSAAVAMICFVWSYLQMPDYLMGQSFFELLFWGGGHVLQFTYTLLMLVCWLMLSRESGLQLVVTPRVVLLILFVGLVCVFVSPLIYLAYPLTTPEHVLLFTWLMRWGGSLATLPLALAVLMALLRYGGATQAEWQARSALQCSLFLFGIGGCIGFPHLGQRCHHSRALPRIDCRSDPCHDGRVLCVAAAPGAPAAQSETGDLAADYLQRRPIAARGGPGVVRWLRRAAQGGRRRAGTGFPRTGTGHGANGIGRAGVLYRGPAVPGDRSASPHPGAAGCSSG